MVGGRWGHRVGRRTPVGVEFCLMSLGMTVLDAITYIEIGVDAVTGVTTQGLINLLVVFMS